MNYCVFCGFHLDKLKCINCGARFKVKVLSSEEGTLAVTKTIRIIGKRRQPIRSLRRFSSKAAVCSLN